MKTLNFENSYAKNEQGNIIGPITQQKMAENDGTAVTVICITYNHEKFIAQALDSFLMQKTNFKFKVFVGEDCGPDNTAAIVREYAEKYPDIIIPFIREHNMGAQRNLIDLCQRATSPYIAFCEGDDYWIDEYKLQKQFDYMEEHKNIPVCVMQTEIDAPPDWFLRSWYKEVNRKLIIPDSIPTFKKQDNYSAEYYISKNIGQTSTFFFRWNYDLKIPEEYYKGLIGDVPLLLMQLGNNKIGYIANVGSVYRINEGSAFFNKDMDSHFLKTRLSYVHWMSYFWKFAKDNFSKYPIVTLENRLKLESANYLNKLVQINDTEKIAEFFEKYPEAGKISLNAYLSFYRDSQQLTRNWTWEGYKLVVRNRYYRNALRPYVYVVKKIQRLKNKVKPKLRNLASFICYWMFTGVPKKKNIWVFSGFNKRGYMDNCKYLYEWVVEHHPEINAYWLTLDNAVYNKLKAENKPVLKMRTWECIKIMSRAKVAFTDHFVMSDYDNFSGFNDNVKVVQLWHGVGLKSVRDLTYIVQAGVMFSNDMLPEPADGSGIRILKKFKYFRHAYFREKFERYFMLVCPGEERIMQIAEPLNIPREHCFFSGHPRNRYLHVDKPEPSGPVKVLYAPTFRWSVKREREMVEELIKSFDQIETCMEEINGEFMIRLHPHTWRNYAARITTALQNYPCISYDTDKDIYQTLGTYSIMISDYSSIAYDFVLLDRPIVFYCPDLEEFIEREDSLNYDYMEYSPGPKTKDWSETMLQVKEYVRNPKKDSAWRVKIRDEFYKMEVNDENNSERIVNEVKKRLGMSM